MIVALVVGAGFVVLLIAPTIHRKINEKSRRAREDSRVARAEALRTSADGTVLSFERSAHAAQLRDRLLLSGVRAELIQEEGHTLVVYNQNDEETVVAVRAELDL